MAGGEHSFGFNGSIPIDVGIELGLHIQELSEAQERTLAKTERFKEAVGLPPVAHNPQLVGEYVSVLYGVDRLDSSVITNQQLANLCAIKDHATAMLVPTATHYNPRYRSLLENAKWAHQPIENIGQDMDYVEGVREVVPQLSAEKVRAVNMMRFATRVWLDRFSEEERQAAAFSAAIIFGEYFKTSLDSVRLNASCASTPEEAYLSQHEGLEALSTYAFAGIPMSKPEAQTYVIMSRRAVFV